MKTFQKRPMSTTNHKVVAGSPSGTRSGSTHEGRSRVGLEVSSGVLRDPSRSGTCSVWGLSRVVGLLIEFYQLLREVKDIMSQIYGSVSSPLSPQTLNPVYTLSLDARGNKLYSSMSDYQSRNEVMASDSDTSSKSMRTHIGLSGKLGGQTHPSMCGFQSQGGGPPCYSDSMCTPLQGSLTRKTNTVSDDLDSGSAVAGAPYDHSSDNDVAFDFSCILQTHNGAHAGHPEKVEWLFRPCLKDCIPELYRNSGPGDRSCRGVASILYSGKSQMIVDKDANLPSMRGDASELVKAGIMESKPWADVLFSRPDALHLDHTPLIELGELSADAFLPAGELGPEMDPVAEFSHGSLPGCVSRVRGRSPSPHFGASAGGPSALGGTFPGGKSRGASGRERRSSSLSPLSSATLEDVPPLDHGVEELIDSLLLDPNETMLENLRDLTDDNAGWDIILD